MDTRKTYVDLFAPILALALLVTAGLIWQAARHFGREKELYVVAASLPSGEITQELLDQMELLPGCCGYRAMYCLDAELRLRSYSAQVQIRGVPLGEYPLTVIKSAGEKQLGTSPLLIVGESFFESLTDAQGHRISERQARVLEEQMCDLTAEITVTGADGGAEGTEAPRAAMFLGEAKEEGVYMDAQQMRNWMAVCGHNCAVRRVELTVRGQSNSKKAQESLQEAGFLTEDIYAGQAR